MINWVHRANPAPRHNMNGYLCQYIEYCVQMIRFWISRLLQPCTQVWLWQGCNNLDFLYPWLHHREVLWLFWSMCVYYIYIYGHTIDLSTISRKTVISFWHQFRHHFYQLTVEMNGKMVDQFCHSHSNLLLLWEILQQDLDFTTT